MTVHSRDRLKSGEQLKSGLPRSGWGRGGSALLLVIGTLALPACGAADAEPADESRRLQALLSVKRIEEAGHAEDTRAHALAQFVRLPLEADARGALVLAGLESQLPEVDHCLVPLRDQARGDQARGDQARGDQARNEPARNDYESLAHLELLAAGDVNIRAGSSVSRLALNLFPLSGAASGVLYTTRDQAAEPLPASAIYNIDATGSDTIPQLNFEGRAPDVFVSLSVSGTPIAELRNISRGEPLDLTWAEGEPGDLVYVQLLGEQDALVCSFRDEQGSGTVPAAITGTLPADSAARLSVHRVRELSLAQYEPRLGALLRFDFELAAALHVD